MPLDYERIKNWRFADTRHSYTQRDSILYALGIGLGADPSIHHNCNLYMKNSCRHFPQ